MQNERKPEPKDIVISFRPYDPKKHFVLGELSSGKHPYLDEKKVLLSPFIDLPFSGLRAKVEFLGIVNAEDGDNPEDDPNYIFYSGEFGMKELRDITGAVVEDVREVMKWEAAHPGRFRKWVMDKGWGGLFAPSDMPQGKIYKPGRGAIELPFGLEEIQLKYGGSIIELMHRGEL